MFVILAFALLAIGTYETFTGSYEAAWNSFVLGNLYLAIFYICDLKQDIKKLRNDIKELKEGRGEIKEIWEDR